MNDKRKMCMLKKVDKVTPIEGADRVEAIHIGGWVVVEQKGLWKPGDFCAYYEVDSFLPTNDKRYKFLAQFGEKNMTVKGTPTVGHVLRTRRLRGQYSQGLILKPEVAFPNIPESAYETIYERKACLDGPANVCEYVPDLPPNMGHNFIGRYDAYVAPRTDCERAQNVSQEVFDLIKKSLYYVSVKVDGTSITMCFDPRVNRYRIFSHNNEFALDQPGIGATAITCAKEQGLYDYCINHPGKTIQAELVGPGIQGNPLKLEKPRLYVFSVWDMLERRYLDPYDQEQLQSEELAVHCVPLLGYSNWLDRFSTPDDLIAWADGMNGNVKKNVQDEGVVIHILSDDFTDEEYIKVRNELGATLQMKAINNHFLMKVKK